MGKSSGDVSNLDIVAFIPDRICFHSETYMVFTLLWVEHRMTNSLIVEHSEMLKEMFNAVPP